MSAPAPPTLPIPTAFAWLLLESLEQNSWLKKIAQTAAIGAALMGQDEERAGDTFYKHLANAKHGKEPGAATLEKLKTSLRRGGIFLLEKRSGLTQEHRDHIIKHLDSATGPFTALAICFVPSSPTAAQKHLLDYSGTIDQLGAAYTEAAEADDLAAAKRLFLDSNFLDEAYWSFPEPGMEDPRRNREAMRDAAAWHELARAAGPLLLNVTLAWMSCLDLAIVSSAGDPAYRFPYFTPLATRLTPEARAALRENRPPPAAKWSDCLDLPVPNLIRMLKAIERDMAPINGKRPTRPADKGAQEELSTALKEIARRHLLSNTQFDKLLRNVQPKPAPHLQEADERGFEVHALHLAANLFSLLTPREGQAPTNASHRKRAASITVCEDIPAVYESWWRQTLKDVTGETSESPRPVWFTRLLGETGHTDRPD